MEKRRIMTLLAVLFLFVGGAFAQTRVNGTVISQDDGQPVIGATVQVVGTNVGTVTNAQGQFSLTTPAGKDVLRITYVGMDPLEVTARPNAPPSTRWWSWLTVRPRSRASQALWPLSTQRRLSSASVPQ